MSASPAATPGPPDLLDLRERARGGDGRARAALIEAAIPLARTIARRHSRATPRLIDDIEGEALAALPEAVDTWEPGRAGLAWWVEKKALHQMRRARYSGVPVEMPPVVERYAHGRWAESGSGVAALDVLARFRGGVSIHALPPDDGPSDWHHPEAPPVDMDAPLDVERLMERVAPAHREIVADYFGLGGRDALNQRECGEKHGLCESRISQVVNRAIGRMRGTNGEARAMEMTAGVNGHVGRPDDASDETPRKSRHKGVVRSGSSKNKPWMAQPYLGGKPTYLGYFSTEDEAAGAIEEARRRHAEGLPVRPGKGPVRAEAPETPDGDPVAIPPAPTPPRDCPARPGPPAHGTRRRAEGGRGGPRPRPGRRPPGAGDGRRGPGPGGPPVSLLPIALDDPDIEARDALARFARAGAPTLVLPRRAPIGPAVAEQGWRGFHAVTVDWEGHFKLTIWPGTREVTFRARAVVTGDLDAAAALARFAAEMVIFAVGWRAMARATLGGER